MISSDIRGITILYSSAREYMAMHEGLRIINQVLVVVLSSSCHYALHFTWILWTFHLDFVENQLRFH